MKIDGINKIYCVNLERRPDRKKQAELEFSKHDIDFEFFYGVDGHNLSVSNSTIKPGHVGCVLSHLNLYKHLSRQEEGVYMITEDDVIFADGFINLFYSLIEQVPSDWQLLYFGGNHNGIPLSMVSKNVHRLVKTYTTHCYLIKSSALKTVIENFEGENIYKKEVDVHLSDIQKILPCYGFFPHLAWQREGFSDIEMRDVKYEFLKSDGTPK